jgi:16S rRNA (uracil1498-N3)-methyltransferase
MGTNEAPVVRAPCPDLGPGEHVLPEAVGHYLARVLRLRAGATFVAFDGARAVEWDATVLAVSGGAVRVRFASPRPALRPAPVAWVHGLPKGDKADAIVRDLTELGATLAESAGAASPTKPRASAAGAMRPW